MSPSTPRVIAVRRGLVQPSGSWLYVWLDVDSGDVAYVGGTGFDPELRAYLHVGSDDPELGRVRAAVPHYDERDFDVLAFALPDGVDRSAAKQALIARLVEAGGVADDSGSAADLDEITAPILQEIDRHRRSASQETSSS